MKIDYTLIRYWLIWKIGQRFYPHVEYKWGWYKCAYKVRKEDLKQPPNGQQ